MGYQKFLKNVSFMWSFRIGSLQLFDCLFFQKHVVKNFGLKLGPLKTEWRKEYNRCEKLRHLYIPSVAVNREFVL